MNNEPQQARLLFVEDLKKNWILLLICTITFYFSIGFFLYSSFADDDPLNIGEFVGIISFLGIFAILGSISLLIMFLAHYKITITKDEIQIRGKRIDTYIIPTRDIIKYEELSKSLVRRPIKLHYADKTVTIRVRQYKSLKTTFDYLLAQKVQ